MIWKMILLLTCFQVKKKFQIIAAVCLQNLFTFFAAVQVLPMPSSLRENVSTVIKQNCSKAQNVVFALLIANNRYGQKLYFFAKIYLLFILG